MAAKPVQQRPHSTTSERSAPATSGDSRSFSRLLEISRSQTMVSELRTSRGLRQDLLTAWPAKGRHSCSPTPHLLHVQNPRGMPSNSPPLRRSFTPRIPSQVSDRRSAVAIMRRRENFIPCRYNAARTVLGAPHIGRRPTMSVKTLIAMFATVAASFAAPTIVQAAQEKPAMQTAIPKPTKTGHAAVNGVNYYYAVYGTGEPLLLLHGGLGQIEMFGPNLAKLAQSRQVIGVDLQGHGRTTLGDRADQPGRHGQRHGRRAEEARLRQGRRARLFDGRRRRVPVRRSASADGSPPGAGFRRLRAGWVLSGDAAAAGGGRRRDGGADEGNADVQVVRGDRAASGRVPEAARPDGRAACASRTTGRRTSRS